MSDLISLCKRECATYPEISCFMVASNKLRLHNGISVARYIHLTYWWYKIDNDCDGWTNQVARVNANKLLFALARSEHDDFSPIPLPHFIFLDFQNSLNFWIRFKISYLNIQFQIFFNLLWIKKKKQVFFDLIILFPSSRLRN